MTLLQIKAVVYSAKYGSVSSAAKKLNIAQSNVSAYIRELEKELGVKLLVRSGKGVIATEQGNQFIEHADIVLKEQELILNINKLQEYYRLRVGSMNFSVARDAFNMLCIENAEAENVDMMYCNVSISKGVEMLKNHKLDIVVGFIKGDLSKKVQRFIEAAGVEKKHLGIMEPYIRMRKDHPLTTIGIQKDGTINTSLLKDYPYIDYDTFKEDDVDFNNNFEEGGIHQIFINDEKSRYEIMSKTNAYSMGKKLSTKISEEYGLVSIPIKDLEAEFCVLTRVNEMNNPIIEKFISLIENKGKAAL